MLKSPYVLTESDAFYLRSISRMLGDKNSWAPNTVITDATMATLKSALTRLESARNSAEGPSLADEILSDNHDWLDCFIDMVERR